MLFEESLSPLQHFPSQEQPDTSHAHASPDRSLPENYTSWTSLQINQMKKQKTSGDSKAVLKQPNSYHSVDSTDLSIVHGSLTPAQRRRAQNRASQRAFRERKERHVKTLEQQLEDVHRQYEELLRAYDWQKEEIFNLRAQVQDLRSENEIFSVPHNSPLEFASHLRSRSLQSENDMLCFEQNDILMPQSQSLTPASNLEDRKSVSRSSASEEHTPFGSLLPLTPAGDFENVAMLRTSNPFFTADGGLRCSNVNDYFEKQQQDDFGSPGFTKEFAVTPSADIFGSWR
jgi:hypothetical protein